MTDKNRRLCTECHVGRMLAYKTRTDPEAGIVVRYRKCSMCGASDRLVLDLAMLGKHVGPRISKLVQTFPTNRENAGRGGEYKCAMYEKSVLITLDELRRRLGVSARDYRIAQVRGLAPGPTPFGGLYSWPGVCRWLEDNCPVVDKDSYGAYIDSLNSELENA